MNFDEWYKQRGFNYLPGEKELMEIAFTSGKDSNHELSEISAALHYPERWDTSAYPTMLDAIKEISECSKCSGRTK